MTARLLFDAYRICRKCGTEKPIEEFYRHPTGPAGRLLRCKKCVNTLDVARKMGKSRHLHVENLRRFNRRNREKALAAYGGKCACCGEGRYEFLHIYHIGGGGSKHRRETGAAKIVEWLKSQNYPPGFRVLCANCNLSLGKYGYCPHNTESRYGLPLAL